MGGKRNRARPIEGARLRTLQVFLVSRILRFILDGDYTLVARQHFAQSRVTRKFQINLPAKLRTVLGPVSEGDYIIFFRDGDRVYLEVGTVRPKTLRP